MSRRSTSDWQAADSAHFLHPFTDHHALAAKGARIIERGDGIHVWDSEGHRILDAMSGLWCVNVGYGQQALVDAAARQMQTLPFYNAFFQTATKPAIELAETLASVAPHVLRGEGAVPWARLAGLLGLVLFPRLSRGRARDGER